MAAGYKTTITQQGLNLIAQAAANGTAVIFTRLATGSGEYEEEVDLENVTGLVKQEQEVTFTKKKYVDDATVMLVAVVSNTDLTEGYYITEIGVFAQNLDGEEILFSISRPAEDVNDYMPSADYGLASIQLEIDTTIANADSVTVVQTGVYALAADLEALKEDVEEHETAIQALAASMGDAYSDGTAYEAGVYFIKNNTLYRTTAPMAAGEWNDDAVEVVTIAVLIEEAQGNLYELINMIVSGTVTTPMLAEDGTPILTEDGEVILATRHI